MVQQSFNSSSLTPSQRAVNDFVRAAAEGDLAAVSEFTNKYGRNALDKKDKVGRTALMRAAHDGQIDVVNFLLEHGVSVNATDGVNRTALHHAAMCGRLNVVKTLLDHGAFYQGVNSGDVTPMKLAKWNQNISGNDRADYTQIIALLKNWPKIQQQRQAAEKKQRLGSAQQKAGTRKAVLAFSG